MEAKKYYRILLWAAAGIALLWLGVSYLLPVMLPFLIGFGLSRAAEPMIRAMGKKEKLPRWLCSTVSMVVIYAILGAALFFLVRGLILELEDLVVQLPSILAGLEKPMQSLQSWLTGLAARLPDGFGISLSDWITRLFESGSVLADGIYRWLIGAVTGTVTSLPGIMIFLFTAVLSSFMLSSELPVLRHGIARRLPEGVREKGKRMLKRLRAALGGWVKAQIRLTGITFVILTVGLWILKTDYPLLLGALIALIDALPILGVGTVMIPWAIISFLQGLTAKGIGLLIVYFTASFTRTALEPRMLGRQMGLPPVVTLFSLYAGYRLVGILGMILFPILAILVKQFMDLWEAQKN